MNNLILSNCFYLEQIIFSYVMVSSLKKKDTQLNKVLIPPYNFPSSGIISIILHVTV